MNKKLEAVERHIRKLCPELMELSFGCKARLKYGDHIMTLVGSDAYFYQFAYDFLKGKVLLHKAVKTFWKKDDKELFNDNCGGFEIIGHDITLEHVFKAMRKNTMEDCEKEWPEIQVCNAGLEIKVADAVIWWDLDKSYQKQKPEVIDSLYQIFKLNEDE